MEGSNGNVKSDPEDDVPDWVSDASDVPEVTVLDEKCVEACISTLLYNI